MNATRSDTAKLRKDHSKTAVGLIAAAAMVGLAPLQSLVDVTGPALSVGLTQQLGLSIQPGGGLGQSAESDQILWGSSALLVVCSILLLATRVRYLGAVWR